MGSWASAFLIALTGTAAFVMAVTGDRQPKRPWSESTKRRISFVMWTFLFALALTARLA